MRILHLISSAARSPFFNDLVKHSDRSGSDFVVGSLSPAGGLQDDMATLGVESLALDSKGRADFPSAVVRLARFLSRTGVDVVHCHLQDASFVGLAAARMARTPFATMTRHYADANLLAGGPVALFMDRLSGRHLAHAVIAVSGAAEKALLEIDRVPGRKIHVIPNGYDWDRVRASPEAVRAVREEFGGDGVRLLCTVGRLDPFKGHDVLFEAFARSGLAKSARLLIVGRGPHREALEARARALGVMDSCVFLGFVPDPYAVMGAADLMVHPSRSEAQCQVIIEALALARPVIATDVGSAADVILPGETGWLVPAGDPATLARSIGDALSDPGLALRFARRGQSLVRSLYPIRRTADSYQELYKQNLDGSRGGRHRTGRQVCRGIQDPAAKV